MSDLFHEAVPDDFVKQIFEVMGEAKQHIFQVLTKRPERMLNWTRSHFPTTGAAKNGTRTWPAHVWLGVSVENQLYISRIKFLQQAPALVRFLSVEPLLGPVNLGGSLLKGIHWVIVGGESGPRARPLRPEWVFKIREQCEKHQVPFFFKQWGAYDPSGKRVGKKVAGRILEGRTWDEMPVVLHLNEQKADRGSFLFREL
jgi:protein gp37